MSQPYRQPYQAFQQILHRLQTDLQEEHSKSRSLPLSLQVTLGQAQEHVQQQLMQEFDEAMDGAIAARIQSIQTEINKQMRLLSMDILFLQTARQSDTRQTRQEQIRERVERLLQYCQMVLEIEV